jgi:3-hydroxyisobutyrate dehydrogenase-like beta-hydroxyacid dehydrogenase
MMKEAVKEVVWLGGAGKATLKESVARSRGVRVQAMFVGQPDVLVTDFESEAALRALLLGEDGLLNADRSGMLLLDMSHIGETLSREIAAAASRANAGYLRAPLTFGPATDGANVCTAMVSGPRDVFDDAHALLGAIATHTVWLGAGEEARAMTRVLDVMTGVSMAMWAEALVFGEAVGLDWQAMLDVMATSAIGSPVIQAHSVPLAEREFGSSEACEQMAARLGDALAHGKATGTVLTLTGLAHQMYLGAVRHGHGKAGITAVVPWLEEAAGVSARVPQTL